MIRSPALVVVLEFALFVAAAEVTAAATVGDDCDGAETLAVVDGGDPGLLLNSTVSMPSRDMIAFMFSG